MSMRSSSRYNSQTDTKLKMKPLIPWQRQVVKETIAMIPAVRTRLQTAVDSLELELVRV